MKQVFEKIKQRITIAATEACGYAALTRVVSEAEVKEILDSVVAEYNNGWIPCSERLPEKHVDVLVDFGDENPIIAWYSHVNDTWKNSSTDYVINVDVIAWQPLPESYNPGKE